jgi:hypothetical protein
MVILAIRVLIFFGFSYFVYSKTIARIYNFRKNGVRLERLQDVGMFLLYRNYLPMKLKEIIYSIEK